jgi:hypothetical protein
MLTLIWAKIWKYLVALGAILLAIVGIFLKGRAYGKAAQQGKVDAAVQDAEVAHQQATILESRHDTDTTVQNLPEAPAQVVATAQPGTAAGQLRDDWTRD